MEFTYEVLDEFDEIFDEKGNTFLAMRKVSWNEREPKLELRKWIIDKDGEEKPNKGFSFVTEEGPHELTKVLVDKGYGDTNELMEILSKRDNFNHEKYDIDKISNTGEEYINPNTLFEEE